VGKKRRGRWSGGREVVGSVWWPEGMWPEGVEYWDGRREEEWQRRKYCDYTVEGLQNLLLAF
jgi:hypothetical protein